MPEPDDAEIAIPVGAVPPPGQPDHDLAGQTVAVVPIRSLADGKTRLAPDVSPTDRSQLIARMLRGVVAAATGSGRIETVLVVSPDERVLALARDLSPRIALLRQPDSRPGLIPALTLARMVLVGRGAATMLILFGDLPLLTAADVHTLTAHPEPVVLAPDRHGDGTNVLMQRLDTGDDPARFSFRFGTDSFRRHRDEAGRLGLPVGIVETPGTSLDVDTPDDLAAWRARMPSVPTGAPDGIDHPAPGRSDRHRAGRIP